MSSLREQLKAQAAKNIDNDRQKEAIVNKDTLTTALAEEIEKPESKQEKTEIKEPVKGERKKISKSKETETSKPEKKESPKKENVKTEAKAPSLGLSGFSIKKKPQKQNYSVYLECEIYNKIREFAEENGTVASEVINEILKEALKK